MQNTLQKRFIFFQINPKQELLVIKTTQGSKNSWPGKTLSKHFKDASPFEGIYSLFFWFSFFLSRFPALVGCEGGGSATGPASFWRRLARGARHHTRTPCQHTCTFLKRSESVEQLLKPSTPGAAHPQPVCASSRAAASRLPAV